MDCSTTLQFQEGGLYKITSAFNGTVLDLKESDVTNGSDIICYPWYDTSNQKWIAHPEGKGFRLAVNIHNNGGLKVLDEHPNNYSVTIKNFNGLNNQKWTTIPAPNCSGRGVLIQNVKTGNCLRNMGGQRLEGSVKSMEDIRQHWFITKL